MALSDKNIVITPNIGNTENPKIVFSGADAGTVAQNITLEVLPSNNGTVSFTGSNGQLFNIINNFAGTIFSVNDGSGIPSIEVLDTGEVKLAEYNGFVGIYNSTSATSTSTGALVVRGGVGISGSLYAGALYDNGSRVVTTSSLVSSAVSSITAGTDTAVSTTTGAVIKIWSTATLDSITSRTASTKNAISITDTTTATSTSTGALKVSGGIGANNAWFGKLNVNSSATFGGVATFNSDVVFNGAATYLSSTNTSYTDNLIDIHTTGTGAATLWTYSDGRDIGLRMHQYRNSTGTAAALVLANDTGYLEWYGSGAQGANVITVSGTYGIIKTGGMLLVNTTTSTGTDTGALVIVGGVGVGGKLYASELYDNGNRVVTADKLGTVGVSSITAGTDTVVSNSIGAVTIWNKSTLDSVVSRGNSTTQVVIISNTSVSTSTSTGALQVSGGAYFGKNINQNGVTIGSTMSYSVLFGKQALDANTTGDYNTAIGHQAMLKNITGNTNVAIGQGSLINSTIGSRNVAVGASAIGSGSTDADDNTAIGYQALYLTIAGSNVAIGAYSLYNKTTGTSNVAVGRHSGYSLKNGVSNVFVGSSSSYSMTAGTNNLIVGHRSGYSLTNASNNVFLGAYAGYYLTTVSNNVIIGGYDGTAAPFNSTGTFSNYIVIADGTGTVRLTFNNVGAMGVGPSVDYGTDGYVLTSSSSTNAVQWKSLESIATNTNLSPYSYIFTITNTTSAVSTTTGALQVAGGASIQKDLWIGGDILLDSGSGGVTVGIGASKDISNVAFGSLALRSSQANQNTAIGALTLSSNTIGRYNTAVGYGSGYLNKTANYLTFVGFQSGEYGVASTASTYIGAWSGFLSQGIRNTALGYSALRHNNTGTDNIAIGYGSMYSTPLPGSGFTGTNIGSYNIALGSEAMYYTYSGGYNIALGYQAMKSTGPISGTGISDLTGGYNIALGYQALTTVTSGSSNIAIGASAGSSMSTSSGNLFVGYSAGGSMTTGSNNVFVGYSAGSAIPSGSNNVIIGGNTGTTSTLNNTVIISDGAGNARLTFNNNGAMGIGTSTNYGTSGYILKTQGNSSPPTWEAISNISASLSPYTTVFNITNNTESTSSSVGALTVTGGVGINDKLIIGSGAISKLGAKPAIIYGSGSTFSSDGDAQASLYVLRVITNGPVTKQLTSDGNTTSTSNLILISDNSNCTFKGLISAKSSTTSTAAWEVTGVAYKGTSAATTVVKVANINRLWADTNMLGLNLTVTANTAFGGINFNCASDQSAGTNIRWIGKIDTITIG